MRPFNVLDVHVACFQIMENEQGGVGRAIGEVLLDKGELEKLPIQGEGAETDPAKKRLNKLVRSCGQLKRERRPNICHVLAVVKDIYDSLSAPGGFRCACARGFSISAIFCCGWFCCGW